MSRCSTRWWSGSPAAGAGRPTPPSRRCRPSRSGPTRRPATPADRDGRRPVTVSLVTVPEALLVPLLDTAAALLADLEADEVPVPLRRLIGWDRRGLARSTARTQLRRAIEDDADFAERVRARLLERPEVVALTA